jgi:hypothetical protein
MSRSTAPRERNSAAEDDRNTSGKLRPNSIERRPVSRMARLVLEPLHLTDRISERVDNQEDAQNSGDEARFVYKNPEGQ